MQKLFRTPGFTTDVKGFHLHHNFIITSSGLLLGLLSQEISFNDAPDGSYKSRPITEKLGYRRLTGLQTVKAANLRHKVISVCDRESDISEFFSEPQRLNEYLLVRSSINRCLTGEKSNLRGFMDNKKICR